MSGLFSTPTVPAAATPHSYASFVPSSVQPARIGNTPGLTRASSGGGLGADQPRNLGNAYQNTVLGEA